MIHFINDNPFHKWWSIELPISHLWAFNHKYTASPYRVESNASFIDEGLLRRHWIQKGKSYSCFGESCFVRFSSIGVACRGCCSEEQMSKAECYQVLYLEKFCYEPLFVARTADASPQLSPALPSKLHLLCTNPTIRKQHG